MVKKNYKKTPPELNGTRHLQGLTRFIADEVKPSNMLYVTILHSAYAAANIKKISTHLAENMPGIFKIITAKDIPGENQIGHLMPDEPLLADNQVIYYGQPIALILSEDVRDAELAIPKIEVTYEVLNPILSIEEAIEAESFYIEERKIERGDWKTALQNAPHQLSGQVESGAQEHFYMETQRCRAVLGENDELILSSATQSTGEIQEICARVLGLSSKDVTIDVKRLGGAFGGKERNATLFACLTGLAAYLSKRPCELVLSRIEDISTTGKRHPFKSQFQIGFDESGKILSYNVDFFSNGGASIDLSIAILERAMLHAENTYYIPNIKITGKACRTNLPPNTAFRGFGGPQGIFVIENAIFDIARFLKKDPVEIQKINMYQEEQLTPYAQKVYDAPGTAYIDHCLESINYPVLKEEIKVFNQANQFIKRGLATIPIKFGISFTTAFLNQGSALIWIYTDGSISVSHGGIEMGQQINQKVALIVAKTLGISVGRIRIESANTKRIGNASPTAASSGTDINGNAARLAAEILKNRLKQTAAELLVISNDTTVYFENDLIWSSENPEQKLSFEQVVHTAYMNRVDLGAHAFYKTPDIHFDREKGEGTPFYYFVNGSATVMVEIDLIHGYFAIKKACIAHETAKLIDEAIDRGQITGAFVQGYGWCTMEEENFNQKGQYLATTPSTYKFPTIRDIPEEWDIKMFDKTCKKSSVYGSKAVGEPPFIYGEGVWFAILDAIESIGNHQIKANLKHPATPEAIILAVDRLNKTLKEGII